MNLIIKTRYHFAVLQPIRKCVTFSKCLKQCPPVLECNGYVRPGTSWTAADKLSNSVYKTDCRVIQLKNVFFHVHVRINFNLAIYFFFVLHVNISELNRLATASAIYPKVCRFIIEYFWLFAFILVHSPKTSSINK